MTETVSGLLQFGALGALVVLLLLIYKLALPLVTTWAARKTDTPPPRTDGFLSHSDQFARTIYDVNKTLSEVAVMHQTTNEIIKNVRADQKEMLKEEREHHQKAGAFIDKMGDTVLRRLG